MSGEDDEIPISVMVWVVLSYKDMPSHSALNTSGFGGQRQPIIYSAPWHWNY